MSRAAVHPWLTKRGLPGHGACVCREAIVGTACSPVPLLPIVAVQLAPGPNSGAARPAARPAQAGDIFGKPNRLAQMRVNMYQLLPDPIFRRRNGRGIGDLTTCVAEDRK